jgi:translation initiation factor 2B subunit (eIF-2B alpha/beta/delta family)
VNITLCPEITRKDLERYDHCTNNEYHKKVAELLDRRICDSYVLYPNNYIAHDLRYGQTLYRQQYTDAQFNNFLRYMERLNDYDITDPDILKDIFLGIYANPVKSKSADQR